MEVKEAIKFLEELKTIIQDDDNNLNMTDYGYKKMDMTIDLLKSLEAENKELKKYKQMWEGLHKKYGNYWMSFDVRDPNGKEKYIDELIEELEQKYLKEATND